MTRPFFVWLFSSVVIPAVVSCLTTLALLQWEWV